MAFEVFEKLEAKVQQAITLLQMEIKEKNTILSQEVQQAQSNRESLVNENEQLKVGAACIGAACVARTLARPVEQDR